MKDLILKKKNIDFLFILLLIIGTIFATNQNATVNITTGSVNMTVSINIGSLVSNLDTVIQSSAVQNNTISSECVRKFSPIISKLPSGCQSRIVSLFNANTIQGRCCTPANFTKSIKECLMSEANYFSQSMSKIAISNKKAFSCFKNNEVFKVINNLPLSKDEQNSDDHFLRTLILSYNNLNHLLSKCIQGMNTISMQMLTRMCLPSTSLPKFFNQDSSGNYVSVMKLKKDDVDTHKACANYLRNHTQISNVLLDSYVDQVNYLLGVDQCNYYSDFFNFDINQDKNDIFFPSTVVPSSVPDTFDVMLGTWNTCANSKTDFQSFAVSTLMSNIQISQKANPNGLSTFIGRSDIISTLSKGHSI